MFIQILLMTLVVCSTSLAVATVIYELIISKGETL